MASALTVGFSTAVRLSVAACLLILAGRDAKAEPPKADVKPAAGDCGSPTGGAIETDFRLPGVYLPLRHAVIDTDVQRWLRARYPGGRAQRVLETWTEALRCGGWAVVSKGARGPDAQAWLTQVGHPDVVVVTAASIGGAIELLINRFPRLDVAPAWMPASLSSPLLAPAGSELLRWEGSENSKGRHLLHVAYPSSMTVAAVEAAWVDALAARGWRADSVGGQRYLSGPDGVVGLVVWRGVGGVELNLHRVTDKDPRRELWRDLALPVLGIPDPLLRDTGTGMDELGVILRCSQVDQGAGASRSLLRLHDKALTGLGWRRVSGPLTASTSKESTSVYRAGDRQVVVTLSATDDYCRTSSVTHHRFLARAALGAPWSTDDWPRTAGKSGIVVKATAGDPDNNATLVVEHRSELLGLGPPTHDLCATVSRKVTAHWVSALRRRGWRPVPPSDDSSFARGQEQLSLGIDCEYGKVTVNLSRFKVEVE